jgi:hypothetical protein
MITLCRKGRFTAKSKKGSEVQNFQKRMAKMAQVLGNLNENFFDCEPKVRFDFAVKFLPNPGNFPELKSKRESPEDSLRQVAGFRPIC